MEQVLQMRGAWDVPFHERPKVPAAMAAPTVPGGMTEVVASSSSAGARSTTSMSGYAASSSPTGQKQDAPGTPAEAKKQAAHELYQNALRGYNKSKAKRSQAAMAGLGCHHQNVLARGLIILALESLHQVVTGRHPTAKGVWDALDWDFRSRGMARAQKLRTQLDSLR